MNVFRYKCKKCGFVHEHIQGTTLNVTSECMKCNGKMERVEEKTEDVMCEIKVSRSVSYTSPSFSKRPYEPDNSFFQ